MWKNRAEVEKEIKLILKNRLDVDEASALIIFDGLESIEPLDAAVKKWRERGAKRIIAGIGVMPSNLLEPVKKLVDELLVLKIPRFFKTIGQYYEEVD